MRNPMAIALVAGILTGLAACIAFVRAK